MNPFLKPLSSQRYFGAMTKAIESQADFLIDFGCAECDFLVYVSRRPERLLFGIGVDKDDFVLSKVTTYETDKESNPLKFALRKIIRNSSLSLYPDAARQYSTMAS